MEFKVIIIGALIIGLFSFALISFMVQINLGNTTNTSLLDNPSIEKAFGNISHQLNKSQERTETQREAFARESSNPILTTIGFIFTSIINAGQLFISMSIGMFNTIFIATAELLGIHPIVIGVIFAILLITAIFSLWKVIKAGG